MQLGGFILHTVLVCDDDLTGYFGAGSDAEDEEEGRLSHDVADPADLEPRLLVEQAL